MGEYRDILLGTLDDLTATTFAERLERFYAHNGYDKVSPSLRGEESAWEELSAWERGKRGSGWWSSDMSQLFARVSPAIDPRTSAIRVVLTVDTTGQHITEEDVAFWRTELAALGAYLEGDAELVDLRAAERARASAGRKDTVRLSLYGFMITFVLLFVLVLVLHRSGLISL